MKWVVKEEREEMTVVVVETSTVVVEIADRAVVEPEAAAVTAVEEAEAEEVRILIRKFEDLQI
jgi:hypothetical protein